MYEYYYLAEKRTIIQHWSSSNCKRNSSALISLTILYNGLPRLYTKLKSPVVAATLSLLVYQKIVFSKHTAKHESSLQEVISKVALKKIIFRHVVAEKDIARFYRLLYFCFECKNCSFDHLSTIKVEILLHVETTPMHSYNRYRWFFFFLNRSISVDTKNRLTCGLPWGGQCTSVRCSRLLWNLDGIILKLSLSCKGNRYLRASSM